MTEKSMTKPARSEPVIYLHARGRRQPGESVIQALQGLGLTLCCRLPLPGVTQTTHGYDQPLALIKELAQRFPNKDIIFLRAGLVPTREQIDDLSGILASENQPAALTLLSNAQARTNPFAGLEVADPANDEELHGLIKLLAPGELHEISAWTNHFALLS